VEAAGGIGVAEVGDGERRALWIYPWDILDAGIEETVLRAKQDWGLTALSLTSSYHSAKFFLPRRSHRRVFLSGGSAVYFRPDETAYQDTPLRPVVTPEESLLDVLDRTTEACRREGLGLRAWTVALHNSRLGGAHPDVVEENVFGDRYSWALCPCHPDVRAYLVGLVRDLATNHDLDAIDLESTGFHGLVHGHHHELTGITLAPLDEFLLGLCFCRYCLARAASVGVDGEGVRQEVRTLLEARFAEEAAMPPPDPADLRPVLAHLIAWPSLAAYVRTRLATVTTLVDQIKQEALTGTKTSLALTATTFVKPVANAWLEGMDLRTLAAVADEIIALSYVHDPREVAADVRLARELCGGTEKVVVGLSLLAPATTGADNLRAKVDAARAVGARKFSFYNFGFLSEARLAWLAELR
jgi:hypothetical protein